MLKGLVTVHDVSEPRSLWRMRRPHAALAERCRAKNISWRARARVWGGHEKPTGGVRLLVHGRGDVNRDALLTSPSVHAVLASRDAAPIPVRATREPKRYALATPRGVWLFGAPIRCAARM